MLDLLTLLEDDGDDDDGPSKRERAGSAVDVSGKRIPQNVRVILDSGLELQCDVKFEGLAEDDRRFRRYAVIAEADWSKYWIKTLMVGELPRDIRLVMHTPDVAGKDHLGYAHKMNVVVEQWI